MRFTKCDFQAWLLELETKICHDDIVISIEKVKQQEYRKKIKALFLLKPEKDFLLRFLDKDTKMFYPFSVPQNSCRYFLYYIYSELQYRCRNIINRCNMFYCIITATPTLVIISYMYKSIVSEIIIATYSI